MWKRALDETELHVAEMKVDADELKDTAAHVAANVADAANVAKDWAEPRVGDLIAWLRPRAEKAWHDSVKAAAPHVEKLAAQAGPTLDTAAERLVPAAQTAGVKVGEGISVAHDKVLEELLPRLVAVVNEAAKKHHGLEDIVEESHRGRRRGHHRQEFVEVVAEHIEPDKHHHKGRKLLAAGAAGVAVAGYTFWKRAQPKNDPWAEPWDQNVGADYSGTVKDTKYRVEEVAEHVGEATGSAVAKGRVLAEDVAEKSADLREDVAERAGEFREDFTDRTSDVREKAVTWGKDVAGKATEVAHAVEGKVEGLIQHRREEAAHKAEETEEIDADTVLPIAETVVVVETVTDGE